MAHVLNLVAPMFSIKGNSRLLVREFKDCNVILQSKKVIEQLWVPLFQVGHSIFEFVGYHLIKDSFDINANIFSQSLLSCVRFYLLLNKWDQGFSLFIALL